MNISRATLRAFWRWTKIALILYGLIGIGLYHLQNRLIFRPQVVDRTTRYNFPDTFREINLPYDQQINLNIVQFEPTNRLAAKGVVLFFHGNRNNIAWYAHYANLFTSKQYQVWMIDYPGFGKSTGTFTEDQLYAFALQLYKLARTSFSTNQIIVYGKSLGTGIAAQLASVRDCRCLMLETPYYSMTSLLGRYFPIYPLNRLLHFHFPTYAFLEHVTAPIVIFQGTDDGVIPYANAAKLKPFLKSGDAFVTIPQGSHNDLPQYSLYQQTLDSVLSH
jgi:pimeloyl-ACP methyl ester carboxylesterase